MRISTTLILGVLLLSACSSGSKEADLSGRWRRYVSPESDSVYLSDLDPDGTVRDLDFPDIDSDSWTDYAPCTWMIDEESIILTFEDGSSFQIDPASGFEEALDYYSLYFLQDDILVLGKRIYVSTDADWNEKTAFVENEILKERE